MLRGSQEEDYVPYYNRYKSQHSSFQFDPIEKKIFLTPYLAVSMTPSRRARPFGQEPPSSLNTSKSTSACKSPYLSCGQYPMLQKRQKKKTQKLIQKGGNSYCSLPATSKSQRATTLQGGSSCAQHQWQIFDPTYYIHRSLNLEVPAPVV